jgi:hypothetical protein
MRLILEFIDMSLRLPPRDIAEDALIGGQVRESERQDTSAPAKTETLTRAVGLPRRVMPRPVRVAHAQHGETTTPSRRTARRRTRSGAKALAVRSTGLEARDEDADDPVQRRLGVVCTFIGKLNNTTGERL